MRVGFAALVLCSVVAFLAVGAVAKVADLQRGPAVKKPSPWPQQPGHAWNVGDGTVTWTAPLTRPGATKQPTVTFRWTLPASVPAAGAKGKLTITATAGDQDGFAPAFSINGALVRCAGIPNTPSYGTGCADGDHAAVGVGLQPNESKTVSQEFLIRGAPGEVTVVTGAPQNVAYTYNGTSGGGRVKVITEPRPGSSTTVTSPNNVPVDCTGSPGYRVPSSAGGATAKCGVTTTVTDSGGNLSGTTVVGAGERTKAQTIGEAIAACWLIGPDAIVVTNEELKNNLNSPLLKRLWEVADAELQLLLCVQLVRDANYRRPAYAGNSEAAASCRAQRVAFAIRARRGKVVSVRLVKRPLGRTAIRYSCNGSGGTESITVDGRVRGGLRRVYGAKLRLGVVRAKNAPARGSKLTFTFGF